MAYEIILGRKPKDREKYGLKGTIFIGKQYVKMAQTTSLSNDVFMDVASSHVLFVCGKRGGGKSYSMGVIAEGIASTEPEIRQNLSVVIFDTLGVYWTMKYPNHKDADLLKQWNLEPKELNARIYAPSGMFKQLKEQGVPVDFPFAIRPGELNPEDWCMTFEIDINSEAGVLITRIIADLKKQGENYGVDNIIDKVHSDEKSQPFIKNLVENQFLKTESWGLFDKDAKEIKEISEGGNVSIIDLSIYSMLPNSWAIKSLVIGLLSEKLFIQRMMARKFEELASVKSAIHYFTEEVEKEKKFPLVWLVVDEAHEVLPKEGKTTATGALVTILREGRQPGISLILASQQPGKIHTDVMTQSDIVISHQLTARMDVEALGALMQSYMEKGLDEQLNILPKTKGSAIVFDDVNERIFPIQVRPRFTWHGGGEPTAIPEEKKF